MRLLTAPDSDSDLILLDLQMPAISGDAMVGQLMAAGHRLPPVIVISAKTHQTVDAAADSIRAAAVLYKPFAIDDLLDSVRHVLS
jgi:DNA-binding response OmpR family regulator